MQYGIVEISRDEFQEMLKYPTTDEKSTEKDQDSKFLSFLYDTSGMKIEDISDEARELTKVNTSTILKKTIELIDLDSYWHDLNSRLGRTATTNSRGTLAYCCRRTVIVRELLLQENELVLPWW
jgi:DNA-directed RNA polymerase subunit N (RpoN/RPB10)